MVLERQFAMWELGAFFRTYHQRILGKEPPPQSPIPQEAKDGLEGGRAFICRPRKNETPTGLATWSPRGSDLWVDFIYSTSKEGTRYRPRGIELILGLWQHLIEEEHARSIKTAFARELVASDDDFFSPVALRLGMEREDDILLSLKEDEDFSLAPVAEGITLGGWHEGLLDDAIKVMMQSPDPTRLGEWTEQRCRDDITWAAAGHPPGFGDGRAVTAWQGERLVGFAVAAADGLITQIHVLPEFQNKGMGTALLSALVERLRKQGIGEVSLIIGDTNGEALRLGERVGFVDELHYPLWSWHRRPLNLSGVDFLWNGRLTRNELADLYLQACSPRAFTPARLEETFRRSKCRLVARHLGELLAVARVVGDGCSVAFVCDFVVSPSYRFQGLGRMMARAILDRFSGLDRLVFACGHELAGFFNKIGLHDVDNAFSPSATTFRGKLGR